MIRGGIRRVLKERNELLKLFLVAAIVSFASGGLASLLASEDLFKKWGLTLTCVSILVLSFLILATKLNENLAFEDTANGVVFYLPEHNTIAPVLGYRFAEDLARALRAVRAESKAIYADWESEPLARPRPKVDKNVSATEPSSSPDKRAFASVIRVNADECVRQKPKSARLLEESVEYVLIERLSMHLSAHFDKIGKRALVKGYGRDDIPGSLLKNRVLNLLTTPIEVRDTFHEICSAPDFASKGTVYAVFGSDGSVFSRFDLVLPVGATLGRTETGGVSINTSRLSLTLDVAVTGMQCNVDCSFVENFAKLKNYQVECFSVKIRVKGKIKPASILSSTGWEYYSWLDSFRMSFRRSFDFSAFTRSIGWRNKSALLHSMKATNLVIKHPTGKKPASSPTLEIPLEGDNGSGERVKKVD